MSEPIIRYQDVCVSLQGLEILEGINFELNQGEFVYLIGKVGSGKTSFLKTIYGELEIQSGEAEVMGCNLRTIKQKHIPDLRRRLGIVFQDFQLLVDRNVEENLMFVLKATGWKDKQAMKNNIHDVLMQVGMAEKAYKMPYQLSGGEQQRVVIARALLNAPGLILADEPTGNLDEKNSEDILGLLCKLNEEKKITVIIVTHSKVVADRAGRLISLKNGQVISDEVR